MNFYVRLKEEEEEEEMIDDCKRLHDLKEYGKIFFDFI